MSNVDFRIGQGFDVHKFVPGRKLILGGVEIPFDRGLLGHSDADVLCHAVADAVLGAAGLGDIGVHFPPSDNRWKDADSVKLLGVVESLLWKARYKVVNVDATVICERPKIAPYREQMRLNIARALKIDPENVSVKGTTTETLGFTGREEGIAAMAVVLIQKI